MRIACDGQRACALRNGREAAYERRASCTAPRGWPRFAAPTGSDWLLARQGTIETKLATRHLSAGGLVLYDLSSSYFEGTSCPLAKLGYGGAYRRHGVPSLTSESRQRGCDGASRGNGVALLAALSDATHAIARYRNRDEVFREVCTAAVERAGFRFAWVG
ncbi:MAG: hypothetical protein ABI593_05325, partial [Betaproteobacteria bacterium]